MKTILILTLATFASLLLPACESERAVSTTTTTTEETTVHPAAPAASSTTTVRTY